MNKEQDPREASKGTQSIFWGWWKYSLSVWEWQLVHGPKSLCESWTCRFTAFHWDSLKGAVVWIQMWGSSHSGSYNLGSVSRNPLPGLCTNQSNVAECLTAHRPSLESRYYHFPAAVLGILSSVRLCFLMSKMIIINATYFRVILRTEFINMMYLIQCMTDFKCEENVLTYYYFHSRGFLTLPSTWFFYRISPVFSWSPFLETQGTQCLDRLLLSHII